jgi:hypothetical protein
MQLGLVLRRRSRRSTRSRHRAALDAAGVPWRFNHGGVEHGRHARDESSMASGCKLVGSRRSFGRWRRVRRSRDVLSRGARRSSQPIESAGAPYTGRPNDRGRGDHTVRPRVGDGSPWRDGRERCRDAPRSARRAQMARARECGRRLSAGAAGPAAAWQSDAIAHRRGARGAVEAPIRKVRSARSRALRSRRSSLIPARTNVSRPLRRPRRRSRARRHCSSRRRRRRRPSPPPPRTSPRASSCRRIRRGHPSWSSSRLSR